MAIIGKGWNRSARALDAFRKSWSALHIGAAVTRGHIGTFAPTSNATPGNRRNTGDSERGGGCNFVKDRRVVQNRGDQHQPVPDGVLIGQALPEMKCDP